MPLLRISGIPVPVLMVGDTSHVPLQIGENERAEDGSLIINRRVIKETYKLSIVHQVPATAFAFRDLVLGKGECFNFDTSVYGSKGSGPSSLVNGVINGTAKYGAGGLQQTAATGTVAYPIANFPTGGTAWTVAVWRKLGAGAFVHYVVTTTSKGAGQAWVNGVLTADATAWLSVASGVVTLNADAAQTTNLDDLIVLPFEVPSSWPASIQAYGKAFSQLAYLEVDGDLIENNVGTKNVAGAVTGMPVVRAVIGGVTYKAVQALTVELLEI
jgi:hypothetical protein